MKAVMPKAWSLIPLFFIPLPHIYAEENLWPIPLTRQPSTLNKGHSPKALKRQVYCIVISSKLKTKLQKKY